MSFWDWLKKLFGGYDVILPPFKVELLETQQLSEIIDWGLRSLNVPEVWQKTQGEGVKVAVLDTGAALDHPDLSEAIIDAKDFTGGDDPRDRNGHGSHCSGIVAARANQTGVVGVAPKAQLLIGKVLNDSGYGRMKWIIDGIYWALEQKADIISMSLGSRSPFPDLEKAVKKVIESNTIIIAAAGNEGPGRDTISYPGHYEGVICVGSINRQHKRSYFSSTGPNIAIMAPGEDVLSCYPPDKYARFSGTSMATPFVAGVAALILSKHRKYGGNTPCENQKQMYEHLTKVAKDIEDPGWDSHTGWGIVNPPASVELEDRPPVS